MTGAAAPPLTLLAAEAGGHGGAISIPALAFGLFLLVANGFFVAAEIALLAARRARIEERAEGGDARAVIARNALQELSITFSGAQLGITMASLGLGGVAEPAVATVLVRLLGLTSVPEAVHGGLAFAIALGIVVFLHMVVGEMAPKNLALARAEDVSLRLARAFRAYVWLFRPLIVFLNWLANLLVRAVGVEPVDEHDLVHSPAELALALRESQREGTVSPQEARVLSAALELASIDAEAAMTPRTDIAMLGDDASATEVVELSERTGFTRFPVFHVDHDDVVGMVHVKDVLVREPVELDDLRVGQLMRPIKAVPESRDLEALLAEMRRDRAHAVLVVDEFGATIGLVTLEDVLEELVGEISDEFDEGEHVVAVGDREWTIDGLLRRDELERLTGLALPDGETETVNGWLMERLGRLVRRGDRVRHDGWTLRVVDLHGRRAGTVVVRRPDADLPAADAEPPGRLER
jgi:CBS domain containing-hemolysin-like protein